MKKIIYILLLFCSVTCLIGCDNDAVDDLNQKSNNSKIDIVSKEEEENNGITIERGKVEEEKFISTGDKITKDGKYVITYKKNAISRTVKPTNTSGYYHYYTAEKSGHKYLYVIIEYKNLTEDAIEADDVGSFSIKYADKYEYNGFAVVLDGDGDFEYASNIDINPLSTSKIYYLIEVPSEVSNGKESIIGTYTIGDDIYKIKIR